MNISDKIRKNLTKRDVALLRSMGELAQCMGYGAYLVGGSVRDIILGCKSPDIDVVVEGNAISLGEALSKEFGCALTPHRPFGTCTLKFKSGRRVDLATSRQETYKKPGAFPSVRPGALKHDLARRDFTINAVAASVSPGDFGRAVDPFGGVSDIRKGVIRVMHDGSFIDDPTRLFRALRFASRFGFTIDSHTEDLMHRAIARNVLAAVSQGRIKKELSCLLDICR